MSLSIVSDAHVTSAASLQSLDLVESKKPQDSSPSLKREKLLPSLGDTDPSAEGNSDAPDTASVVRGAKLPNETVSEKELNECEFSCDMQKMPSANSIENPENGSNGPQGVTNGLDTVGVKVTYSGREINLERFTESDFQKFLSQCSAKSLEALDKELTSQIEYLAAQYQFETSAYQRSLYYIEKIRERRKELRTSSSAKKEEPTSKPSRKSSNASTSPISPEFKTCSFPGSAKVSVFSSAEIQKSSATSIESTDEKIKKSEKPCEVSGDSRSILTNNSVKIKTETKEVSASAKLVTKTSVAETSEIILKPQTKTSARIAMFERISNTSSETKKRNKFVIPVRRFSFKKISQIPDSDMKQEPGLRRTKKTIKKSKTSKKKGKKSKKSVSKSNSSKANVRVVENTPVPEKAKEEPAQPQTDTVKSVADAAKLFSEKVEEEPAQPQIETSVRVEEVAQSKEFEKCRPLTFKKQTPLLDELFEETKELAIVKKQTPLLGQLFETEPLAIVEKLTTLPSISSVRLSHTAENDKTETVALQEESFFSTCGKKNLSIFSKESWPSVSDRNIEYRDVVGDFVQGLIDNKDPWKENDHTYRPEPSHHELVEFKSETQAKLVDEILNVYLDDPETAKEAITKEQRMKKEKKERMAKEEREWQEVESNMMRKIAEKNKYLEQELDIKKRQQEKLRGQKVNEETAKLQKKQESKPVQEKQKVCDERMRYQKQQASEPMQHNVAYSGGIKLQYRSDYLEKAKRDEEMWGTSTPKYFFIPSFPKLSIKDRLKIKIRNVFSKVEDLKTILGVDIFA